MVVWCPYLCLCAASLSLKALTSRRRCHKGCRLFATQLLHVWAEECSPWLYIRQRGSGPWGALLDSILNQSASDLSETDGSQWTITRSVVEDWVSVCSSQQLLEEILDKTFVWVCFNTACVKNWAYCIGFQQAGSVYIQNTQQKSKKKVSPKKVD